MKNIKNNKLFAKSAIIVTSGIVISKLLGFAREILTATVLGATHTADAFILSSLIPVIIFSSFGYSITTTFIPIYNDLVFIGSKEHGDKFTSNLINILTILSIVLLLIFYIKIEGIVKIFGMGLDGEVLSLSVKLTRILLPSLVFLSVSQIMSGYLQSNDIRFITSIVNIPSNIIVIIGLIFVSTIGIYGVAYILLLGYLIQILIQIPYFKRLNYRHSFRVSFNSPEVKKLIVLLGPVFFVYLAYQVNLIIDKSLATTLGEGVMSCLNYSTKLNQFIYSVISLVIGMVVYPKFSKLISSNQMDQAKEIFVITINLIFFICIPIIFAGYQLSYDITKLLFYHGRFTVEDILITSTGLKLYIVGIIGVILRDFLNKCLYAMKETKIPVINSFIVVFINIILNYTLINYWGYKGLASATSIASLIGSIMLFLKLAKVFNVFNCLDDFKVIIKSIISAVLMSFVLAMFYKINISSFEIKLAILIFLGMAVYLISSLILNRDSIYRMKSLIKKGDI